MSMPKIPDLDPKIRVDTEDAVNVILSSIGFEELGLAHIINAEGEKIQSYLGTLDKQEPRKNVNLKELEQLDNMVNKTLNSVMKKEFLLLMKLDTTKDILDKIERKPRCQE